MSRIDSRERLKSWLRRQRRIEFDSLSRGDQERILKTTHRIDKRFGGPVRKVTGRIRESMRCRAPKGRAIVRKRIKDGAKQLAFGLDPKPKRVSKPKRTKRRRKK